MTWLTRILKLLLSLTYFAFRRALALLGIKTFRHHTVLTYHVVNNDELASFDRQMDLVKRLATPIFAEESNSSVPGLSVSVTFDDAFEDVIVRVIPVLARYNIPVTIFVPTGSIGAPASWISSADDSTSRKVASADVLKNLDPRLARLGSHTVTHPRLSAISPQRVKVELADSKETLELLTGNGVCSLAFPYGSSSADVIRTAQEVGYSWVFANVPVPYDTEKGSPLVGRVDTSPRDWALEFYLKIQGGYGWMAAGVPAKRRLLRTLGVSTES